MHFLIIINENLYRFHFWGDGLDGGFGGGVEDGCPVLGLGGVDAGKPFVSFGPGPGFIVIVFDIFLKI